jgi:hypothetical protein
VTSFFTINKKTDKRKRDLYLSPAAIAALELPFSNPFRAPGPANMVSYGHERQTSDG